MIDLAPAIFRQRLVIEAYPQRAITDDDIKSYLSGLSSTIGMKNFSNQLLIEVMYLDGRDGFIGKHLVHIFTHGNNHSYFTVSIYIPVKVLILKLLLNIRRNFLEAKK